MFHEAFAIVKRFIAIATTDTVEALQRFTNTHVPAQPGTTCLRMLIPMASCNQAAAMLIEYFGEKDLKELVGGSRWWQVRGLKGVQGEWIAMKQDWKRAEKVEKKEEEDGNDNDLKKRAREIRMNKRHERKKSQTFIPKRARSKSRAEKKRREATPRASEDEDLNEGDDEPAESFEELDRLKRVMYYIHGGGYYFGSTSTHRLMITRFARKFGGRAFAVNYRLCPQFPWPSPVQDVLAGYLYLIDPPPEARHKPIDPAHIVIAGDSAGGGLALALLGVLRDLGKPMPAGAVLLSPWCDMTHSFPSILQNTDTDIIPPYSFIHKPSTLWPVPGVRPEDKQTTATKAGQTGKEGGNDAADPPDTKAGGNTKIEGRKGGRFHRKGKDPEMIVQHGVDNEFDGGKGGPIAKKQDESHLSVKKVNGDKIKAASPTETIASAHDSIRHLIPAPLDHLYADPLTIPMDDHEGKEVNIELRQQIQLYATNAQLYHPLCSPILQGSLGGLPPLYILAGNSEVLRDEIIYLAHRAARPEQYPLKKELLDANERCRHDAELYNHKPTKVHLQVYDGQPHVLTLFSFTTSARYAYRAIASFVKHVTGAPTNVINPFPHLENSVTMGSRGSDAPSNPRVHETTKANEDSSRENGKPALDPINTSNAKSTEPFAESPKPENTPSRDSSTLSPTSPAVDAPIHGDSLRQKKRRDVTLGIQNAYDGQVPLRRPTYVQEMIRERVDIRGQLRPLEEEHLLQALQVPSNEIGRIKAGPVSRYLTGQDLWDKKFKRTAKRVDKERAKNEARAAAMLEQAAREGLLGDPQLLTRKEQEVKIASGQLEKQEEKEIIAEAKWQDDGWADLGSFGPLDLEGEVPPPSAIAGRRDTLDSLELLRQSLHMRAHRLKGPSESTAVGAKVSFGSNRAGLRGKTRVKLREKAGGNWKQSTAERQVETKANHGLRIWGGAMNYFTGKSNEKHQKIKEAQKREKVVQEDNAVWVDSPTPPSPQE